MTLYRHKVLFFYLVFLNSVIVSGQTKFTIIGTGEKIRNGDTLYLSYKENSKYILERTTATGNKFTFNGSIKEPVKATIYRNENPEQVNIITESVDVYLEPGIIKINSPDTLTGALICGTHLNDTLQLLRNKLTNLIKNRRELKDPDSFTEEEKRDTALVNNNKRKLEIFFMTSYLPN